MKTAAIERRMAAQLTGVNRLRKFHMERTFLGYLENRNWVIVSSSSHLSQAERVKPWNSVRINLGLGLRGPDIRLGLDNRHSIIEGHRGLRR